MEKPTLRKIEILYYSECEKYVAWKLGLYDLRDTLGKFKGPTKKNGKVIGPTCKEDVEYRDFWHFILDECTIHNGCDIYMPNTGDEPWQTEICECFLAEFGDGPYRVEW